MGGKRSLLKEVMYCVCGFSANSGNKLAKHLGTHGCQSAYASLEDAERARNIPEGQEDKFFIYNRDCKDGREEEKEIGKAEEVRNEEGKQPGPGGLLFGTLFNYLGDEETS